MDNQHVNKSKQKSPNSKKETGNELKYRTGTTGVQKNPNAPDNKEIYVIEPPEHSTQHF